MPTKPGDNKLGKRDSVTLEAYRDRIDPEGRGVAWARPSYSSFTREYCCVCGDSSQRFHLREFAVKPAQTERDLRCVCNACCEKAWASRTS